MSQRAAGERARWLAAVLIVTTIAATGVIVRLWPVPAAPPLLASRHLQLYQAPTAPLPLFPVRSVRLQADRPAKAGHYVREDSRVRGPAAPVTLLPVFDAIEPLIDATPDLAMVVIPTDASSLEAPVAEIAPLTRDVAPVVADVPVVAAAESDVPVASSSRGIVELPAVAVTRAVTIAGRGIMTGLKATSAILRAPF